MDIPVAWAVEELRDLEQRVEVGLTCQPRGRSEPGAKSWILSVVLAGRRAGTPLLSIVPTLDEDMPKAGADALAAAMAGRAGFTQLQPMGVRGVVEPRSESREREPL